MTAPVTALPRRSTVAPRATTRATARARFWGALCLVMALLFAGCSGGDDDPEKDTTTGDAPLVLSPRDVYCPGDQPVVSTPLSGLGEEAMFEAYLMDPETGFDEDSSGVYCLQVVLGSIASLPVELTLAAPDDAANYGLEQTTTDEEGSEEIAYFPFGVAVYGQCRPVTASMTSADGAVHTARMRIGTGCPNG